MIRRYTVLMAVPFLLQCASKQGVVLQPASAPKADCATTLKGMSPASSVTEPTAAQPLPPQRYLAWLEGNYQTDYEPDRKVASEKAKRWDSKAPDMAETEEYLEYLSTRDASGKASDSEKLLKQFLSRNPNEKRAVFLLGVHYLRGKRRELAQYFFSQLEKDPKFVWKSLLYNNLGMIALQDKNRDLAIDYFEKATKAQPPTAAPFVNLGALYLQSRSFVDAEPLFRKALDIDDEFEDAALGLGVCLEAQGKFNEAHKVYASFLSDNPDGLSVLYNDAVVLGSRLKQREQAAEMMLRYIQRGGKETARAHEMIQSWR